MTLGDATRGDANPSGTTLGEAKRAHATQDDGSVTAEFAMVVPAVVLVLAVCLSALNIAHRQGRLEDAASVAARTLARGGGSAEQVVGLLAPGARVSVDDRGELVCVRVSQPGATLAALRVGELRATSCSPSSRR